MDFTVLGLLGPAGSGKDLVADWFTSKGFVKIAFADPMKRFVQRLFGFSVASLWGPSEERNRKFPVNRGWWTEAAYRINTITFDELIGQSPGIGVVPEGERMRAFLELMNWFSLLKKTYPEDIAAREVLQTLGTEWGRKVDPLMWANYAHKTARALCDGFHSYTQAGGLEQHGLPIRPAVGVVIPDHRFKNEVETTQNAPGYVLRLRRTSQEEKTVGIAGHQSEAEQKTIPDDVFDLVLEFPEGIDKVHGILDDVLKEEAWSLKRRNGYQVQYRS